jgi:hypothetical protein
MTTREVEIYDYLVNACIATENEINLVRNIVDGSWEDIFNSIVYARTGYRTFEQFRECELEGCEKDFE